MQMQLDYWVGAYEILLSGLEPVIWLSVTVSDVLTFEIFLLLRNSSTYYFSFDLPLFLFLACLQVDGAVR